MSEKHEDTLTIREMCDAYGVTPRTLRFYEAKELLFPIRDGMKRLFTRKDRARLTLILRGKRFGFSLEDIRQLLDMYDPSGSNEAQLVKTYEIARDRLAQMGGAARRTGRGDQRTQGPDGRGGKAHRPAAGPSGLNGFREETYDQLHRTAEGHAIPAA